MSKHDRAFSSSALYKLVIFAATFFAMVVVLRFLGRANHFILMWPITGVELGLMLPEWRTDWRRRAVFQTMGAIGVLAGGLTVGLPTWFAVQLTLLSSIDVFLAGCLLSPGVSRFDDLKCRQNVLRLCAAATIPPLLTGVLATVPVAVFLKTPVLLSASLTLMANSLGTVLVFPVVLFFVNGEYRSFPKLAPHWKQSLLLSSVFTCVVAAVFWQNTGPFLFVVFPPMMAVLLVLGLEGALATSVILSVVGWFATSHGHGPIWLLRIAAPEQRLLVLQVFLWVCIATAMPVGALLDERRKAERDLKAATSIYETLLANADDMIVLSALDGSERYVSPAVQKLTGWTAEEYLALPRLETVHPDDQEAGGFALECLAAGAREHSLQHRLLQKDGSWRWVESTLRAFGDIARGAGAGGYVCTVRDMSVLKQIEESWTQEKLALTEERTKLADLASLDPLTGLANRRAFDGKMLNSRAEGAQITLLMIDVDYFKLYNDTYGHQAGDTCLRHLAQLLRARVRREGDLVARLGGEEFVVVLQGTDARGGLSVAEELLAEVRKAAMTHRGSPLGIVTVSIGIAAQKVGPQLDPSALLEKADNALYQSKRSGKNRASVHEGSFVLNS